MFLRLIKTRAQCNDTTILIDKTMMRRGEYIKFKEHPFLVTELPMI